MKFLFSILIMILIPLFSYAQIVIEEKVEIDPQQQNIEPDNPTGNHTIQLDIQWDTPQYNASIVGVVVPCQSAGVDWQSGGTISLTINDAMAGFYRLQPRFNTPSSVTTNVTYQLYFDGSLVIEGIESVAGGLNQGAFPHFNIEYTPPLISNYSLYLDNDVSCILTPTPVNIYQFNDCSTGVSWNNTDPLTLTIISGNEFASFYDINRQLIGDSFSGTFSELQDINIIQDSIYKDAGDKYMLVQCEWGGLVRTDSLQLLTQTGDVIAADPSEDSLYTGQTTNVEVYPNDFGGECVIFFPFETTYNAEIIEGNEYGNLIDPNTGEHVQSFTELYQWFGYAYFDYVADGISPDTVKSIIIRINTSDPVIPYTDLTFYIKPSPIYVYTEPEVVNASDTADVIIKHRLEDGTFEDFPQGQTFELAVLDGCVNGNILIGDSVGVYFSDAQQPVKFVTADSLESDSGYVRLRVGTDLSGFMSPVGNKIKTAKQISERRTELDTLRAGFEKMLAEKKAEREAIKNKAGKEPPEEAPITGACYAGGYINDIGYWEGDVKYENNKTVEILLGETKYFQAKYPDPNSNKLIIEEVKPGPDGIPKLNGGLPIDVWGDNPVSVVECDSCGKKMGVYWEKEKPVWKGNVNKGNLKKGLIRIVGRYWHQDSTYIVKLKATRDNGDSASVKLKVVSPNILKSNNQADSYSKTRDVFDTIINIDSLCIYYGGINGIPPQFIKGHIYQEAAKIDFGGTVGKGFAPSYRYEPYTVQKWKGLLDGMKNNPFYILATTNVNPPNHQHVKVIPYFSGDTITVWQIVAEYSQLLQDGSTEESRLYGVRTHLDTMNYGKYKTIQRQYHSFFVETAKILINNADGTKRKLSFAERADSTNKRMIVYLRDEFEFEDLNRTKGMKNMIAQTRIASSYGYFQPLYTTAINRNDNWLYPENADNPPENLNKNDIIFPMATRMYRVYLEKGLTNQSGNNWTLGLESSLKKYILEVWNADDNYPNEVMSNVNRFLPNK